MGVFDIGSFKFFANKVLPTSYDDSLSYYEVLGKVANKLNEIADAANALADSLVKPYSTTEAYEIGDYVWYNNQIWKCTNNNYGVFNPSDWGSDPVIFTESVGDDIKNFKTVVNGVIANQQSIIERTIAGIADPYDNTVDYVKGQYVSYMTTEGAIVYKCISDTTAGTTPADSTKWEAVVIADDLKEYVTALWEDFFNEYTRTWGISSEYGESKSTAASQLLFTETVKNIDREHTVNLSDTVVLNSFVSNLPTPTWQPVGESSCYIIPVFGCYKYSLTTTGYNRFMLLKSTTGYNVQNTPADRPDGEVFHEITNDTYETTIPTDAFYLCVRRTTSGGAEDTRPQIILYPKIDSIDEKIRRIIGGKSNIDLTNLTVVNMSFNVNTNTYTNLGSSYVLPVDKNYKQLYLEAGDVATRYIITKTMSGSNGQIETPENEVCRQINAHESKNIIIPNDAKFIFLWRSTAGGADRTPKEYYYTTYNVENFIESEESLKTKTIFYNNFIGGDYSNILYANDAYKTANGYSPTAGYSNRAQINKYIVSDYVSISANILLANEGVGSCFIGTIDSGFTASKHATTIEFDFTNNVAKFLTSEEGGGNYDGSNLPTYTYDSVQLTGLSGRRYRVEIGRKARCPYLKVFNTTTGKLCGEKTLSIYGGFSSYGRKCGSLYDFPVFGVLNGTIYFESFICQMPGNKENVFIGDSITEGSQLPTSLTWANVVGAQTNSFLNLGRGGGNIDHVLRACTDILPVIKPKRAIVTIGTNGGNTVAKLEQLKTLLDGLNCELIINTIPMKSTSVDNINNQIIDMHLAGARFDLATAINNNPSLGQNTSLFWSDRIHPNVEGGQAMVDQFNSAYTL